ncbi:MAG: hypothetical protein KME22_12185 [Hassallia sp. WJT32-NPBG1]|nr:hypothetical protein [Spirirestis rafaelensis WJT71-NPBG6]MBW4607950.1 hypothetical protein [Hassallia sp. WJT32-NPBG1]
MSHIFLYGADEIVPKSNTKQANLESWEHLLVRLQRLKLDQPQDKYPTCISQTKTKCLRVCCSRPIMVVYPDGVWYRQVTPEVPESGLIKNT